MNNYNIVATYETRISKKTNEPYDCVVVNINGIIEKLVFLSRTEKKLIDLSSKLEKK